MIENFSYILIFIGICLLIREFFIQIHLFKNKRQHLSATKDEQLLLLSLFGIILFYTLNILTSLLVVRDQTLLSDFSAIATCLSFVSYCIIKLHLKKQRASNTPSDFLLK